MPKKYTDVNKHTECNTEKKKYKNLKRYTEH
jgi:hypothetical protein